MKTCMCLLILVVIIVYVKGEGCTTSSDCRLTVCTGTDWVLGCVTQTCTCTHSDGGSHTCSNNGDCGHGHTCPANNQHWRCLQGTCHCTDPN
ncbi:hypothetical protein CHS0354_009323 [Potamilus streckersoni]|uniref:Uncharacterized protein n=1 Tax=Potamilus streckersoni TaxID=2493646 RepID=A0AAE0SMQ2_9BIVA|nr:hypothetical protein CHS0354_009323 [Potamilus streckersoni]